MARKLPYQVWGQVQVSSEVQERVTRPRSVHKLKREQMKDSKGDNTDEKANISKTSGRADTQVGAMERDCQGLYFQPKIGWNGG